MNSADIPIENLDAESLDNMTLLFYALGVFCLVSISGLFSAGETALTAASKGRMAMLEKEGVKGAAMVNELRSNKDRFIGSMLLGNNLMNVLSSALAASVLLTVFGPAGIAYATGIMTIMVLIFAEVLPKTYALQNADNLAMRLAPFVKLSVFVLSPITDVVSKIARFMLSLFGIIEKKQSLHERTEELRGAIELHKAPLDSVTVQRSMLKSILDLADVDVEEVMTYRSNMVMIDADAPIGDILRQVFGASYSRFPVYRDTMENIIGTVHVKSLMEAWSNAPSGAEYIDIDALIVTPWFIPETITLFDQLQAFRDKQMHMAIVVDEYAALLGLVTMEDILEEIVGDIVDEKEVHVSGVQVQPNGSYIINGDVTIRDLNRKFDWNLPDDEDYATIAGLVIHEAKSVPNVGQMFTFFGFRFKILKRQRNQITQVRVYVPEKMRNI